MMDVVPGIPGRNRELYLMVLAQTRTRKNVVEQ
jgi:hypothetical protein